MGNEFQPPRRRGLLIQGSLLILLAASGGYFFFLSTQDASGVEFLLHILIALVILAPVPVLVYRLYGLINARYLLQRDGLRIRWGLRREDIPLHQIEWIRPAVELGFRMPLPWLRWPGALLGSRRVAELGVVEYLSADLNHMILVATSDKIFAISPEETRAFLSLFQQINEMGSLTPLDPQSVNPGVLIGRVWENPLARLLILLSFGVGLVLLGTVAFAVPGLDQILWTGTGDPAPAERLFLLPVLDGMMWLFNLLAGMFLYRSGKELRIAAYLLWGGSALAGVLLLVGSLFLIF